MRIPIDCLHDHLTQKYALSGERGEHPKESLAWRRAARKIDPDGQVEYDRVCEQDNDEVRVSRFANHHLDPELPTSECRATGTDGCTESYPCANSDLNAYANADTISFDDG